MKLTLLTLMIAWVAIGAHNIRGSGDESLVDQSERVLHYRRKYPRRRKSNPTLFLVREDGRRSTRNCAYKLEDEFYDCVDVEIATTDSAADRGDYVFYLDFDTDCGDISDDIEDELGCRSGYRRYKYGTGYRRYRYYKNRWWNRYHKDDDRKSKKSKKDDESDTPRHRWWQHPRRPWWNKDDDEDEDEDRPRRRYPYYKHDDDEDEEEDRRPRRPRQEAFANEEEVTKDAKAEKVKATTEETSDEPLDEVDCDEDDPDCL